MKTTLSRALLTFAAITLAAVAVLCSTGRAEPGPRPQQTEPKRNKRAEFMRQKLEFSKLVLEGLTLENYELVGRNARALKLLSQAAEWEVPTIPDVDNYVPLTTAFQKNADALQKAARDRNLEEATRAFNDLTMTCVKCHKFVRERAK